MSLVPPRVLRRQRALAEAIFSGDDGPPPSERLDWLDREFEDYLNHAGSRARLLLRIALWAAAVFSPLFIGSLPGIHRLSIPDRVRALSRMESSFLSFAVVGSKLAIALIYYEHPDVQREVGYVGFGVGGTASLPLPAVIEQRPRASA